jgi:hypothetical protein
LLLSDRLVGELGRGRRGRTVVAVAGDVVEMTEVDELFGRQRRRRKTRRHVVEDDDAGENDPGLHARRGS